MIHPGLQCWPGEFAPYHYWTVLYERVTWIGGSTGNTPPVNAPTEVVLRCTHCGAQRTQYVTRASSRS